MTSLVKLSPEFRSQLEQCYTEYLHLNISARSAELWRLWTGFDLTSAGCSACAPQLWLQPGRCAWCWTCCAPALQTMRIPCRPLPCGMVMCARQGHFQQRPRETLLALFIIISKPTSQSLKFSQFWL